MSGWFIFSILLSAYNKHVFGSGEMAFPCPLTLTSMHFLLQWLVSLLLTSTCPTTFGGEVKKMSWNAFLATSIPCGCIASFDIGLANLALVRITITFYTMIKASAPIFVLFFAFIFRIEKITMGLVLVIAIISAGELLTVWGEVDFDFTGFILCLGSSVCSGLRWTLVQFKIQNLEPPLKSAVSTMRLLSPSMFFSMLILCIIIERPVSTLAASTYFATFGDSCSTLLIALAGGSLAISMVLCEFYLILKTNAIVLMLGGIIKEMITILVGATAFHDQLDILNISGCIVVFSGVIFYKIILYFNKLEKEKDRGEYGVAESLATTLEDSELALDEDYNSSSDFINDLQKFGILDDDEEEKFHLTDDSLT